jgi:transcriptional regulator with XRE-family HTH domain
MKRGRPKGKSNDSKSYGPLGDLIRKYRTARGMGLADVAKSCDCSVQFISNIEHGRAPLPWDKANQLAKFLEIPFEELQAANLAIRSDFRSFVGTSQPRSRATRNGNSAGVTDAASLVALTAHDAPLRELLQRYQSASVGDRKKFLQSAKRTFSL